MKNSHKIGLGVGTGALLITGAAGFASIAQAADPTASPTPARTASGTDDHGKPTGGHGRHGRGGDGVSAAQLAEKLGVDEAKVTEALKDAREALRPSKDAGTGTPAARPSGTDRQSALARELATALGIDEAKVTEVLETLKAERAQARTAELQTRLDKAVTDGTLTQTEADAVKKAVDAGVIGGARR